MRYSRKGRASCIINPIQADVFIIKKEVCYVEDNTLKVTITAQVSVIKGPTQQAACL